MFEHVLQGIDEVADDTRAYRRLRLLQFLHSPQQQLTCDISRFNAPLAIE